MINNFNFVGIGLQGAALANGLDSTVRPPDITQRSLIKVGINDYDSLFATGLGVIGDNLNQLRLQQQTRRAAAQAAAVQGPTATSKPKRTLATPGK